jgi:hypothetical protein
MRHTRAAYPEAKFLDEIQTKVFLLATVFTVSFTDLPSDFYFFKLTQPFYVFLQTHATSCVFLQFSCCTL